MQPQLFPPVQKRGLKGFRANKERVGHFNKRELGPRRRHAGCGCITNGSLRPSARSGAGAAGMTSPTGAGRATRFSRRRRTPPPGCSACRTAGGRGRGASTRRAAARRTGGAAAAARRPPKPSESWSSERLSSPSIFPVYLLLTIEGS